MPDYAGNNLTSAREISFGTGSQTFSDRVDTFDTDDYYRISLSGRSSLNLAVNGLSANANVQLLDRNGNTLRSSTNSAGIAESIDQVLDANVYYIRVYQDSSSASTDYTLNLTLQNSPKTDILWRDYSTGTNAVWFMGGSNNATITASNYLTSVATNWRVEGIADFNGDNHPDLLWRDYSSGANAVWFMGGTNNTSLVSSTYLTSVSTNWQIEGIADFNGDNRPDLLWRDYSSGANAVWFMGGTNNTSLVASTLLTSVSTNWQIEGIADFNGDNRPDLLWRDYSSGANAVWFMGGTNNTTIAASTLLTSVSTNWQIEGIADFNGDNRPDLLWRDYSSGANAVWFMGGTNNTTIAASTLLTSVSTNWQAIPYTRYEEPQSIDLAGNTTNTAFNVGTLSGSGVFSDRIDSTDPNDYYQFTLSSASTVNLSLNGLSANADLQLLNSNGTVIQGSYSSSSSAESIGTTLSAGTYYVRVYQASGSTNYSLNLSATTLSIYKYDFIYYYNGSNSSADYYTGYAYDYAGKYSVNTFYNPNTALNQSGYDGRYYITGSSLVTGTANPGYVYASTYYDIDSSGASYAAYYGNYGSSTASGYSGLGSEYDYVYDANRGVYDDFGSDNLEVDSLPVVTITANDANAAETLSGQTANPGQFTFTRTGSSASALTVYYTTGGSATNGSDYTSLPTSVTFQAGQSSVALPINIFDDALVEGNETVVLTLNANSAYTLGGTSSGTVTIADNDLPVITITANDANAAETLSGQTANPGQFTFTRTGSSASALTVYYTTGGSATNGSDYTSLPTSVTFQAGQSSVALPINIFDDALVEGNETVVLTLNANSAYTLGATTAGTVTIADNDLPVITITANDANAAETLSGQTANPGQFTVTRTGSTATALTVNYSVGGTATSGSDYSGVATSVTFQAGQSSVVIPINVLDDSLIEGDETVNFVLLANSAYGLGSNTSATVTIADNDAIYRYSFTYYYNGSSTSADYYTGYVYANSGTYTVGSYFDYTTNNNQAGYNGKYYINNFSLAGSSADRGKVYVTTYYDVDSSGNSYSAYYGNLSGYVPSSNGLGTESDYIYDGSTYRLFGSDRDEVDVPRGSVTITSPNGGNLLRPGSSQTITWSDNLTENVKIDLYKGGSFYSTIAASVLSNGSYTWTLPTSLSNGSDYAIRVSSVNNSSIYDSSDTTFSVKADLKKFWFYYNFNPQNYTQADSYVGSVIAPDWMYALNGTYDPSSAITEAGLNGKYLISQVDDYNDDLTSEAGRVFVNDYIDRDNGSEKHFTPYKYSQGTQPSGTNYLGSELDYIDASQSVTSKFGLDYYEADIPNTTIDLTGSSFSLSSTSLTTGNTVTAYFGVQNTGTGNAGSFNVKFYLSTDSTINTSDKYLSLYTISSLNSGFSTGTLSTSLTLPSATDSFWNGSSNYFIGMIIDADSSISESNETNNTAYQTITINTPKVVPTTYLPFDASKVFSLSSNLGANQTIYLDFDGYVTTNTLWNTRYTNGNSIVTPAYDTDGNTSSFSTTELETIWRIWQRVAEDFMPFNVNVTTLLPSTDRLIKSSDSDTQWGIRVAIGGDNSWYGSAGGVAYPDSFNWDTDTPAFVFSKNLGGGDEKDVAEAISHEVGHTLGLKHDGNAIKEYDEGHGSGVTGWAPIMGVGYYQELSQWSKGEYANANNSEDDLAIITTQNGFSYRVDDYGNQLSSAAALQLSGSSTETYGIIETNTDVDWFSFTSSTGNISLNINPFVRGPNLDILATLYNSSGQAVQASNPTEDLSASFNFTLTPGKYYLSVKGTGKGDTNTGYSAYGSLGQYSITGTIA